jgi:DNA-binding Lrp family transcriptional regulator
MEVLDLEKELIIISALRENARYSLTDMSKKTRIPVSTIYDKLKTYRGELIKKYTSIIDFNKLGFNARANVLLKVPNDKVELLKSYLLNHGSVNSLSKVNNGYNFFIEVIFRNLMELEAFLENLEIKHSISEKQVFYVIEDLRREDFLSNPQYLKIRNFI